MVSLDVSASGFPGEDVLCLQGFSRPISALALASLYAPCARLGFLERVLCAEAMALLEGLEHSRHFCPVFAEQVLGGR